MNSKKADLHIHSRHSDGSYRVTEIFRIAKKAGIKCISITDHDSTGSFEEASELSVNYGIEIISGIELSAIHEEQDIHILGYFIDVENDELKNYLIKFRQARKDRALKMINLMNSDGVKITYDDLVRVAPVGAIARPHLAQILIEKGYAYNFQDAFGRFIGNRSKYYVHKFKINVSEAVHLIHNAGGLAVLAHPVYLPEQNETAEHIISSGIDGIETVHSSYDETTAAFLEDLADGRGLLRSGGSDCHGGKKTGKRLLGNYNIPYEWVEAMKMKLKRN